MSFTFDETIVSDLYKDAYGFRPRENFWQKWDTSSSEEKQEMWNDISRAVEASIEAEKAEQALAAAKFEEKIDEMMAAGATNRYVAIRWLVDSMDLGSSASDIGYVCYELGISYDFEDEIRLAMN